MWTKKGNNGVSQLVHLFKWKVTFKGVGSKIGVVRPGACEVNVAVLCAKAVWADGYLSVAHFTACTTVHNGGGRHLRMGAGANCLYACVSTHMLGGSGV